GHDRIWKTFALPVQVQEGIGEGRRQTRVVERLVRVWHIDPAGNETAGQILRTLSMPLKLEAPVLGLSPPVGKLIEEATGPGLQLELIVQTVHAKRRDDVLFEVLILVIAKDDDEVRMEIVQYLAHLAEVLGQVCTVALRCCQSFILPQFSNHLR